MEEDLFSVMDYMKEEGGEGSPPPPKRTKTVDVEHVMALQKKVGTLFPEKVPTEEMVNSEKSLRENIYYPFWSHVAGMLRPPNNRVVFLLDPFHYNILLSDYDKVQKRLGAIRDERMEIFQKLRASEGSLTEANRNIQRVLAYTPYIGEAKDLLDRGRELLKEYKQTLLARDFVELLFSMKSYFSQEGVVLSYDDKVAQWIPLAKNLVEKQDRVAFENLKEFDQTKLNGFLYFLLWQLRNNYDYFITGEERYKTYPKNEFDNTPPSNLRIIDEDITETFRSIEDFLDSQDVPRAESAVFNEKLRALRSDINRLIQDMPNNFEKYLSDERINAGELSEVLDFSYEDVSADESLRVEETDSEDEKTIKKLEHWLSGVSANLVRDDGNFKSYLKRFEEMVSERVELLKREEELEKDATRLKRGTEISVGKNDYLVVANEFKTALERAHTKLTTEVFALKHGRFGRPVSEKDLMLDRRINKIVARIVGLFFLEHWNIYQPKSWAPVRTITDTNRETLDAAQSIGSILGRSRFMVKK